MAKGIRNMADGENLIDIQEFARIDLRVGTIAEAAAVEGTDKLVVMKIDIGTEVRQVVAGIRIAYKPEELVGKQVVIVANLKPAKLRGIDSNGMLLAAVGESGLCIVSPEKPMDNGVKVK
jgi:methionyl-tRNA synthetase